MLFCEGRQFEKTRTYVKTYTYLIIEVSSKSTKESSKKSRKTIFAAKIDKKAFLEAHAFSTTTNILVNFGVPQGTEKLNKMGATHWVKESWEPAGGHFG